MDKKNIIHISRNMPGGSISVDVFERPDGSFGFDEFRRDVKDGDGRFSIGRYGSRRFVTLADATAAAEAAVAWFNEA